jgi:PAS domain S-box-containing protein
MNGSESLQNDQSAATENALRRAVDITPAFIHTARPDGYLDYFNRGWLDFLGKSLEEVCGWRWTDSVHPEDVAELVQKWRAALASGEPLEVEARVRRADGSYRALLHRKLPLRDEHGNIVKWFGSSVDIEDRKRAEEQFRRSAQELQRSEFYLAEGQRLTHMGSWAWSPEVGIKYWSEECYRVQGFDPRDGLPQFEQFFQRIHPDDQPKLETLMQRLVREKIEFETDYRLVHPDGAVRDIHSTGHPVFSPTGDLIEYMGTVIDVTDRKRAEALFAGEKRLLEMIAAGVALNEILNALCLIVEEYRPGTLASILLLRSDGLHLDSVAGPSLPKAWREEMERLPIGPCAGSCGTAAYRGSPVMVSNIATDPLWEVPEHRAAALSHGLRASWSNPILSSDRKVLGTFCIYGRETRSPGAQDLGLIEKATHLARVAIERDRAEAAVRTSEQKYRDLVDTTPAFVHTALPNGDVDFYNRGWLEYVGLPLTDLLGWGWTCMIHREDVEAIVPKWRAALEAGEPFVGESRVRRADGEYRWFLHREEPLRNEAGEIVKWYGSSIEIQERKIAEQRIREQETELRQILDLTPQHIGVLAPDGSRLYVNQTALEYFGITLEQWREPGRVPNSLVHPEDREHFLYARKKRFLEGTPHEFEARLLRHDGEFRWFLFRQTPLKDERGHIRRWYGTATDIEDRKRTEEEIRNENIALREELGKTSMFEEVIGTSSALQMVLARAAKVAPTDSTVLIMGETGTGKELIARAIHKRSKRLERPFISVNCAAVPSSLIMSELFGHEKGAFTGAVQRRIGRFELAEGGTIFLDEVGDLPLETQIALLRVLQEREFERVGGTEVLRADVRVISATNRDLQAAIADGAFRSDLYYRLNVFPIRLPPLRERKEDVPLLVNYFVDRYATRAGKKIKHIQKKALEALREYSWPGNVRELQNVIERSLIIGETNEFTIDKSWVANEPQPSGAPADQKTNERKRIEAALAQSNGKVSGTHGAAAKLGMPPSTLESKIRSLRINKFQFKGV